MKDQDYPLQAALQVRELARDHAAQDLAEARHRLALEEESLRQLETRRLLLRRELDEAEDLLYRPTEPGGIEISEIDRRRGALEFLSQRWRDCDADVLTQEGRASRAAEEVEHALQCLLEARVNVETVEKHREDWREDLRKRERKRSQRLLEEVGAHRSTRQRAQSALFLFEASLEDP